MVRPETLKKLVADTGVGLLAGSGQRFLTFCDRFGDHFRQRTRTVETSARHDGRGLLQAKTKNMERMEEAMPEADHHALQHLLSASAWAQRAVLAEVAQEAHAHRVVRPGPGSSRLAQLFEHRFAQDRVEARLIASTLRLEP